jgi:hypothetical protein
MIAFADLGGGTSSLAAAAAATATTTACDAPLGFALAHGWRTRDEGRGTREEVDRALILLRGEEVVRSLLTIGLRTDSREGKERAGHDVMSP